MKELTDEQIVSKWCPMIESVTKLRGEDSKKAAIFAHHYALIESRRVGNGYADTAPSLSANPYDNRVTNPFNTLLALNLKIIGEIKDLSNIVFITSPHIELANPRIERDEFGNIFLNKNSKTVTAKTYQGTFKVVKDSQLNGLPHRIDWIEEIEEIEKSIIMQVLKKINELLDEGGTLCIYAPISSVTLINNFPVETFNETFKTFKVMWESRMTVKYENNISMDDI